MRKNIGTLFLFIFLFTACGAPATNTPTPTEVILTTPTPEPIKIPSPSEIGLASTQDAGSDVALFSVETVKVDDSQLISRADLLTALELKNDALKAYEDAIEVWLKSNGFGITRFEYIFNPNVIQWRIIVRDAITSNIIGTDGFDEPINFEVVNGVVSIVSGNKPIMLENTKDTEARLIGAYTVLLSDSVNYLGTRVFTHYTDLLTHQKQIIPGFEAVIEEASKIDFPRYDLTESQIENGLLENEYMRINVEDLDKVVQWIKDRPKLSKHTLKPLPIRRPFQMNNNWVLEYFATTGVNALPRIPLLVTTPNGEIFCIAIEVVQQVDENGTNEIYSVIMAEEAITQYNTDVSRMTVLMDYFAKKTNAKRDTVPLDFIIQYTVKAGEKLSPIATDVVNITGGEVDPSREAFRKSGNFSDIEPNDIYASIH